jgi:tetratricopeptide (TPR) repeat protein
LTDERLEDENINIAHGYYRAGKYKEEINYYKEKLAKAQNKKDEAYWSLMSGDAHLDSSKFEGANEYYKRALSLYKEIHDKDGEARCYNGIGHVFRITGNLNDAIENHEKGLDIAKTCGYRHIESMFYNSLGFDYSESGNFKIAIKYYFSALEIIENEIRIDSRRDQQKMTCCGNIGIAYKQLRKYSRALHFINEGLKIAKKLGDKNEESSFYADLGNTYLSQGKIQESIEFHNKALQIDNKTDNIYSQRFSNANLGLIYYEINRLQEAYHYLKRSIDLTELIARELIQEVYLIGFLGKMIDPYYMMISTCLQLGYKEEAFRYVERGKSRALISMLAASELLTPASFHMTTELKSLITKERELLQSFREIQKRHLKPEESLPLNQGSDVLLQELDGIYNKIKEIDPEYVSFRQAQPISLEEIRGLLS